MKKFYMILLALGVAVSSVAQSKLDMRSRTTLRSHKMQQLPSYKSQLKALNKLGVPENHITGFVKLGDGATAEQLKAEGMNVFAVRGDIALVSMPVAEVERMAELPCVKQLELSRPVAQKMDRVRANMGVDKIHAGAGLPQAYTGKGVIAGIVDNGFDVHHINFRNEDGSSRVKQLSHIYVNDYSTTGYNRDVYTTETMDKFYTDAYDNYHGSHTLGIMAGGYKGKVNMAEKLNQLIVIAEERDNPYYGVAPETDIVASCGDLNTMFIAMGVEDILNYAYDNNQPAVINLSLGSNIGSHDGLGVMSQYLDLAAEEAIICLAAGNEGDIPIALNKTFTKSDTTLKTFINPMYDMSSYGYINFRQGSLDIYSNDETPILAKVIIYNKKRGTVAFSIPISENTGGVPIYYSTPEYASAGDYSNANFTKAFSGYVGIGSELDPYSGRYHVIVDYFTSDNTEKNADGNYILGIEIVGKEGQRVDCFVDGYYTDFAGYNQPGFTDGSCNGSINDFACGKNVIAVGAYTTRTEWASLDRKVYNHESKVGEMGQVSLFSSYGTLIDGRNLPQVCAPGETVISSSNSYYVVYGGLENKDLQGSFFEEDRPNYWHVERGTSMSSPALAGAIALWLEANPNLTVKEAQEIIEKTAVKDASVLGFKGDPVKWGAGKFDAYAGLKEVIRRVTSGIADINAKTDRLIVSTLGEKSFNVFLGGEDKMDVTIYNMQGQIVLKENAVGDEITVDASGLNNGVYILKVNGTHSQKIVVK